MGSRDLFSFIREQNKMNRDELNRIRELLYQSLSSSRYQHSLGVAYTAACLAMRYGADPEQAELAGLLHDCAKEYREEELLRIGTHCNIIFSAAELAAPQVLHAIVGPCIAEQKYHISSPEILSAIRWHTTGKENMSLLEKIIFTADYIEPNRDHAPNLSEMRALAFQDLTQCVFRITEDTLRFLKTRNTAADPMTQRCYLWLKENGNYDNTGNR